MMRRQMRVGTRDGLHARPAAQFAARAAQWPADVTVEKEDGTPVNAKSLLALMTLGVRSGDTITVTASGDPAVPLLDDLQAIVTGPAD
ncbi:HPr family phosphocarrier protein (plasmid) [Kitasatospora sp. NBC_00070]|uniref:HPr family phosphocarrier protein n=1 Tax=Kitasatospora sp. NBC_00070 TaxID=2975962 RepID=UPI002F915EE5